jgi:hypothetical protein
MTLSSKDIQFLKELKRMGYSAEDSYYALESVKR